MKLTISQIKNINARKSAVLDKIYEDVNGTIYKGDKNGLLVVFQKGSETSLSPTETVKEAIVVEQNKSGITQDEISNLIMFRV